MPDEADFSAAATRAGVAARALELGQSVDRWSLTLAALALAGLYSAAAFSTPPLSTRPAQTCLLLSLIAAGVQKAYALRVAFDARLIGDWARRWNRAASTDGSDRDPAAGGVRADLLAFDRALAILVPVAEDSTPNTCRDLDSRLRGARQLLVRQLIAFALQFAAAIAAALANSS